MVSWRRKLVSSGESRSRKPVIVAVDDQGQIKSMSNHVSISEETSPSPPNEIKKARAISSPPVSSLPSDEQTLAAGTENPKDLNMTSTPTEGVVSLAGGSHLLNLPADIIFHLSYHLSFNALLAFRSTCRSLHHILSLDHLSVIRTRLIINYLADEAMQRATYRRIHPHHGRDALWNLFSIAFEWQLLERPAKELRCYECLEVKPLRMFVERMSSRGTGLGGRHARQRRCKDCMRRSMSVAGVWWREHWLRRNETVRRTGRVERYVGWAVRGTEPSKVKKGEEVGVCTECGTGQFELWWGCAGCFEKEQTRRQREEWSMMGLEPLEDESWLRWMLEKNEAWRGRRDKKKRERHARRAECGGKWWNPRRYAGLMGIDVRWRGSWAERVESLVDHLEQNHQRQARLALSQAEDAAIQGLNVCDNRGTKNPRSSVLHKKKLDTGRSLHPEVWQPQDVPKRGRWEIRCAMCWTPSCRRRRYIGGLTYGLRLDLGRCCDECHQEEKTKLARRRGCDGGHLPPGQARRRWLPQDDEDRESVLECLEDLFAQAPS